MKPLVVRGEARAELLHEINYYGERRPGYGVRFQAAVAAAFNMIKRFQGIGIPGPAETRRVKVKGFPFTVVYREEPDSFVVFAIAPDRRQPGYWLSRIK